MREEKGKEENRWFITEVVMSNVLVIHFAAVQLLLLCLARYVWNTVLLNSLILQSIFFVSLISSIKNCID